MTAGDHLQGNLTPEENARNRASLLQIETKIPADMRQSERDVCSIDEREYTSMSATGIIRIQRRERGVEGAVSLTSCWLALLVTSMRILIVALRSLWFCALFSLCGWRKSSGLGLVYPHFSLLCPVMRNCEVIAIQFWDEDCGFGSEPSWNTGK